MQAQTAPAIRPAIQQERVLRQDHFGEILRTVAGSAQQGQLPAAFQDVPSRTAANPTSRAATLKPRATEMSKDRCSRHGGMACDAVGNGRDIEAIVRQRVLDLRVGCLAERP